MELFYNTLYGNVHVCSFDCCEKLDILVTLLAIIVIGLCFTRLVFVVCNVICNTGFCQQNNKVCCHKNVNSSRKKRVHVHTHKHNAIRWSAINNIINFLCATCTINN